MNYFLRSLKIILSLSILFILYNGCESTSEEGESSSSISCNELENKYNELCGDENSKTYLMKSFDKDFCEEGEKFTESQSDCEKECDNLNIDEDDCEDFCEDIIKEYKTYFECFEKENNCDDLDKCINDAENEIEEVYDDYQGGTSKSYEESEEYTWEESEECDEYLNDSEITEICVYISSIVCEKAVECELIPENYLEQCNELSENECEDYYENDGISEYCVPEGYEEMIIECLDDIAKMSCDDFNKGNLPSSCSKI